MKLKKLAARLGALGLLAVAAPSFAIPTLTIVDGLNSYVVDPFGGMDWQSNATAVSTAPVFDGVTQSTTTYLASATEIKLAGGANSFVSGLGSGYEFTIKATINETQTCLLWSGLPFASTCVVANFTAVGGTFDIYYDSVVDSNIVTGTGFVDGTKVISGSILPGPAGIFSLITSSGVFDFDALVTFTNLDSTKDAYFNPALTSSNAIATLQIGGTTTDWTPPTSWVDGGGIPTGAIVFQADGNQTFNVPEPTTLALLGLGLVGFGAARRRRPA